MNCRLFGFILLFAVGCAEREMQSLPDATIDMGNNAGKSIDAETSNDLSIDPPEDLSSPNDSSNQKCDEEVTETCLSLGFFGGDLHCSDGHVITADCLKCPSHETRSVGSLEDTWTRTGPPGGNITALLALENNVVLAGTGRTSGRAGAAPRGYGTGIYRSDDGGKNFSLQQEFFDFGGNKVHNFSRVGISNRIYASVSASTTDTNGVWMSDDAGLTWTDVSAGLHDAARPRWVAVAPGDPERVYLTVEGRPEDPRSDKHSLYRRDSGSEWTLLEANGSDFGLALGLSVPDRETVLLQSRSHFFRSSNGGKDFTADPILIPNPTSNSYIPKILVNPKNPDHIFRTTENVSPAESLDGGKTWEDLGLGFGQTDIAWIDEAIFVTARSGGLQTWVDGRFTFKQSWKNVSAAGIRNKRTRCKGDYNRHSRCADSVDCFVSWLIPKSRFRRNLESCCGQSRDACN